MIDMQKNYINDIINELKPINPSKIILFGSYAQDNPSSYSDIDLLVVTNENFYPSNYRERMDVQLRVSKQLNDIIKKVPIDLIVYTKPMYERFLALNSTFAREINLKGKLLYEDHN